MVGTSLTGRRVFLTGHTGFKGGYLALWLARLGAKVRGYALDPPTEPNLFTAARVGELIEDERGDLLDFKRLSASIQDFQPEIIFHLAAQPLVRRSYANPVGTYATNVMGTAHVLESARGIHSVRGIVVVTSDKCYENHESETGYTEDNALGGYDPYSSSKACCELVASAYRASFFPPQRISEHHVALATARAGNVIGGGDWAQDRLVPDLVRGFTSGVPVSIRNPAAVRPWQHVLEPLSGYLMLAEELLRGDAAFACAWNFGPGDNGSRPVSWIASALAERWGKDAQWVTDGGVHPHETNCLKLDSSRARKLLGWQPKLSLARALDLIANWYGEWRGGGDMRNVTMDQIDSYQRADAS